MVVGTGRWEWVIDVMAMPIRSRWTQACQMVRPPSRQAPHKTTGIIRRCGRSSTYPHREDALAPREKGSYSKPHAERNSRGVSFTDGENHCVSVPQKQIGRMSLNVKYAAGCGRSEDDRWSVRAGGENGLLGPGPTGSPYLCGGTVSVYLPTYTYRTSWIHHGSRTRL